MQDNLNINTMIKTAGIAIEDYKQKTYESELRSLGINNFKTLRYSKGIKLIKVKIDEMRIKEVHELCNRLELQFKAQRN